VVDAAALLARLRENPRHVAALADLLAEEVLATPAREFVDPVRIGPAVVAGLRAVVDAPEHTAWLEARFRSALSRLRPRNAAIGERLPEELLPVLGSIARRRYTPSRKLVRAVIDHDAMRELSRTILHTTLLDFAKKVGSILPDTSKIPGAGMTSKLFGVARGVVSAVGLDAQLEDRVRQFVDGAVGKVIDMIVERASDPRFADQAAAWRVDVLGSLLDLPESVPHAELAKLDPARAAADLHAGLAAIARWDRLPHEVEAALAAASEALGDATVGDMLEGSGLVAAWRERLEAELRHHLARVVEGERFAGWLAALVEDAG
jgi:hypothetical protein